MKKTNGSRYRWFVVGVFFVFMLLHQADKLLIGPLTSQIMDTFKITATQMGAVSTGALIVGAVFYPLWGYLYDRYARVKLLALASFLWGATTWFNAIAPNYGAFLTTRASTGIDDSSYPGLYSMVSDYFGPQVRGKVYGILQLTAPLGYLIGMILGLVLSGVIGWRRVFYLTGSLGIVVAAFIYILVKEPARGQSEPEMSELEKIQEHHFSWKTALDLFKKPSMLLIFAQGFFGVFPWNAITYFFFIYLEKERHYDENTILITMVFAILILSAGYPLGGMIGDYFFKRSPRGRMFVSAVGVIIGAALMWFTLNIPLEQKFLFGVFLAVTAIFIPIASPNVASSIYDISLPEVRSTANAVESFIESSGAALAPLMVGLIADHSSYKNAFLVICTAAWVLCAIFFTFAAYVVPKDIAILRRQMQARAEEERVLIVN